MSPSTNKGNISTLLFTLTCIACAALVAAYANIAVGDGFKGGKYENPNVASKVVGGTIYDASDRILAMDVPANDIYLSEAMLDSNAAIQTLSLHLDMTPDEIKAAAQAADAQRTLDGSYVLVKQDMEQTGLEALEKNLADNGLEGAIEVRKKYRRTYPTAFHSAQLIQDIENVYEDVLFPIPEFDVSTTYGKDIHLSIDLDVQYLLDLVVQQVYEIQNPESISAGMVELGTSKLIACTTYPFYNLNDIDANIDTIETQELENLSFPTSFSTSQAIVESIHVVDYATDHRTGDEVAVEGKDAELYNEASGLSGMISSADGSTAVAVLIPQDNPQYALYICSNSPKYYTNSTVLEDAVSAMEEGLSSQGRL